MSREKSMKEVLAFAHSREHFALARPDLGHPKRFG